MSEAVAKILVQDENKQPSNTPIESQTKERPFICEHLGCKKSYSIKQHLVRHINIVHNGISKAEIYICAECKETFVSKQNVAKHIARKHRQNFLFKCNICPRGFRKKTLLASHLYQHTGTKLLSCNLCDKKFATQTERCRHQAKHKLFKCDECDEEFSSWTHLLEHRKKNHISKEYICDICQKVFKLRPYIVQHMKIHTFQEERTIFRCHSCPKYYTFKKNLVHHIMSVHDKKTYNCYYPGCEAKLSTQSKLKFHYNRHINSPVIEKSDPKPRKKRKDAGINKRSAAAILAGVTAMGEKNMLKKLNANTCQY